MIVKTERFGDRMKTNFSEMESRERWLEEQLSEAKKEYRELEMTQEQLNALKHRMKEAGMESGKKKKMAGVIKFAVAAAVLVGAFVILPNTSPVIAHAMEQIPFIGSLVEVVTLREYQYETDRNKADIEVPEIKPIEVTENPEVQEKLERTTEEINAEIQKISGELIEQFEKYMHDEQGYQDIVVKSEVLDTTQDYFTLKLICYQGAGSGYQWNYYYTIDLNTGERLQLKDIFVEGADYISPISENIKKQMQERMDADEKVCYWLNDEIEGLNFKAITDETSFYLNEKGNVVIVFNEGDVAPMYMGTVEFEIPAEVLADIRKS